MSASTIYSLSNGPLTHDELHTYSHDGVIKAYVHRELDQLIGADLDDFNDGLSEDITGSTTGLTDLTFEADNVINGGMIQLAVTGTVAWDALGSCEGDDQACDQMDDDEA